MTAPSGLTDFNSAFVIVRSLPGTRLKIVNIFPSEQLAIEDAGERFVDTGGEYTILRSVGADFVEAASGVLQNQINTVSSSGLWNISFSYASQTDKRFKTNSSIFERVTPFFFPGTNNNANPTVVRVFGFTQQASATMTVRVFDSTNGNQIAQITINDTNSALGEDNTLTNLPPEAATFEIQIKSSNSFVEIESFDMR